MHCVECPGAQILDLYPVSLDHLITGRRLHRFGHGAVQYHEWCLIGAYRQLLASRISGFHIPTAQVQRPQEHAEDHHDPAARSGHRLEGGRVLMERRNSDGLLLAGTFRYHRGGSRTIERNRLIYAQILAGDHIDQVAHRHGLSRSRVYAVVRFFRRTLREVAIADDY
jgi:hypothetical protein